MSEDFLGLGFGLDNLHSKFVNTLVVNLVNLFVFTGIIYFLYLLHFVLKMEKD